jgi:8-oxo-dGTP pyrophosphatase MutT (NUDIX family)
VSVGSDPRDAAAGALARVLAHPDVLALRRALAERPGHEAEVYAGARLAAVALLLRAGPSDEIELLLVKRAEWEGDPWSGHVALPGGRREIADATLEDTAVRETGEEISLDVRRHGLALGTLDDLSPRTPTLPPIIVRPYVFVVEPDVEVAPSSEVQAAFWVSLAQLRDPALRAEATVVVRGVERRVTSFRFGDYTVWGMTERILLSLLEMLGMA